MIAPRRWLCLLLALSSIFASGCRAEPQRPATQPAPSTALPSASLGASRAGAAGRPAAATAPGMPAESMAGFDAQKAFAHVTQLVAIGPRPPGSEGIRRAQQYIRQELEKCGCIVEEDDFHASTPLGRVPMKNILAKRPGRSSNVIMLMTHYDTKRIPDFVGANDGGSSTGLMLELARLLCARKSALALWIAFVDGEEAFVEWSDTDGTYGSRQLAAKLALSGELKRVKAVILADLIGDRDLDIRRDSNSTPWLTDLVWKTAARLGYQKYFLPERTTISDDHIPFTRRGVPAVDIIDLNYASWHTPADQLDQISAQSLGIVGHVLLEVLPQLEKKFQ